MTLRRKKNDWRVPIVDALGVDDWWFDGMVARVIDGDTVLVSVELAPGELFQRRSIRLGGINAGEKKSARGQAAKAALEAMLPMGLPVVVVLERGDEEEKFGRWLGRVACELVPDVAAEMVRLGKAKPWNGKGPRPV